MLSISALPSLSSWYRAIRLIHRHCLLRNEWPCDYQASHFSASSDVMLLNFDLGLSGNCSFSCHDLLPIIFISWPYLSPTSVHKMSFVLGRLALPSTHLSTFSNQHIWALPWLRSGSPDSAHMPWFIFRDDSGTRTGGCYLPIDLQRKWFIVWNLDICFSSLSVHYAFL